MSEKLVDVLTIITNALMEIVSLYAPPSTGTSDDPSLVPDPVNGLPEPLPTATDAPPMMQAPPTQTPLEQQPATAIGPGPDTDLDTEHLPWDVRIHSKGRTKVVAGTWKLKRGVTEVIKAQVKTELRVLYPLPTAPPPTATDTPSTVMAENAWARLVAWIEENQIPEATVLAACAKFNQADIGALQNQLPLVPLVAAELGVPA